MKLIQASVLIISVACEFVQYSITSINLKDSGKLFLEKSNNDTIGQSEEEFIIWEKDSSYDNFSQYLCDMCTPEKIKECNFILFSLKSGNIFMEKTIALCATCKDKIYFQKQTFLPYII